MVYIYIPGSSRYVKCMPLVVFLGEKAHILHTWKIQVYIYYVFSNWVETTNNTR